MGDKFRFGGREMAKIAVYSVKGGVGKTTFAANLGWCAAKLSNRRTLVWDLDAVNGSGFLLGVDGMPRSQASSLITLDRNPERHIHSTSFDNLDVLPADESLRNLDQHLQQIGKRNRLTKLSQLLSKRYERIIFDCPAVLNEVSAQVVRGADLVIVPLPPSPLSKRSFDLVVKEIKGAGSVHPPILPVLSMMDMRRNLHRAARAKQPNWPAIPLASAMEQCAVRQQPVPTFAPYSPAARSITSLWQAIESKLLVREQAAAA